jgi:hypothetical protein
LLVNFFCFMADPTQASNLRQFWAEQKNPHLIIVIEKPVGLLSKMPLMKELVANFGLYEIRVDYCAFG